LQSCGSMHVCVISDLSLSRCPISNGSRKYRRLLYFGVARRDYPAGCAEGTPDAAIGSVHLRKATADVDTRAHLSTLGACEDIATGPRGCPRVLSVGWISSPRQYRRSGIRPGGQWDCRELVPGLVMCRPAPIVVTVQVSRDGPPTRPGLTGWPLPRGEVRVAEANPGSDGPGMTANFFTFGSWLWAAHYHPAAREHYFGQHPTRTPPIMTKRPGG
jgi:hypothetical protein